MLRQATIELGDALYNRLMAFNENRGLGKHVFVTGTPGMGKSILTWQLIQRLLDSQCTVLYSTRDDDDLNGSTYILRVIESGISVREFDNKQSSLKKWRRSSKDEKVIHIKGGAKPAGMRRRSVASSRPLAK